MASEENRSSIKAAILSAALVMASGALVNIVGYGSTTVIEIVLLKPITIDRLAFFAICMATGAAFFFFAKVIGKYIQLLIKIIGFVYMAGVVLHFQYLGYQPSVLSIVLSNSCVAAGSICSQMLVMLALQRLSLRVIAWVLLAAVAAGNLLFMTVQSFAVPLLQASLSLLLSAVILLLLFLLSKEVRNSAVDENPAAKAGMWVSSLARIGENRNHIILVFGAAIIIVASFGLSDGGIWGGHRSQLVPDISAFLQILLATALYLVVAALSMLLFVRKPSLQRFQLPIVILITGFIILAALELAQADVQAIRIIGMSVSLYCRMLAFFLMLFSVQRLPYSPIRIFGIYTVLIYTFAAFWSTFLEDASINIRLIGLVIAYFLILLLVFSNPKPQQSPKSSTVSTVASDADVVSKNHNTPVQSARLLAQGAGLTVREEEVLAFLLQGRSVPYIAETLVISRGTVKTHARHIYAKLEVHNKQELLDLAAADLVTQALVTQAPECKSGTDHNR